MLCDPQKVIERVPRRLNLKKLSRVIPMGMKKVFSLRPEILFPVLPSLPPSQEIHYFDQFVEKDVWQKRFQRHTSAVSAAIKLMGAVGVRVAEEDFVRPGAHLFGLSADSL